MKNNCLISTALALSMLPAVASAQDAAPVQADDPSNGEIVVTAQRREQALNDVGISISVRSGEELKALGVVSTADLNRVVPALSVVPASAGYAGTPVYTLRGVGFNEKSLSALSAVSVYQDEAPLSYPYMTAGPLVDIARVEVLRGPQGTLYGQNSTGGSINYISARPTNDVTAGATISYGSFSRLDLQGYVSGPLTETLGIRVAGRHIGAKGWQRSVTRPGDRLGSVDQLAGRVLLDWDPSDRFHIKLNLNAWRDRSETLSPQVIGFNPADLAYFNGTPFPFPFRQDVIDSLMVNPNQRDTDWTPGNYKNDNSFKQASLRIDYDLTDQLTLTSLSTLNRITVFSPHELDGSAVDLNDATTTGRIRTFNQEVRLSADIGAANIIVGGNYSKDKIESTVLSDAHGSTTGSFFATVLGLDVFGGNTNTRTRRESYAAFGNLDYALTDQLSFTGGLRYTKVKLDFTGCSADNGDGSFSSFFGFLGGLFSVPPPYAEPGECITFITQNFPGVGQLPVGQGSVSRSLDEDNVSWRAGLNFKPTPDTLIYGNVSRGYKSGDIPSILALFDTQLVPVKQEKLTAYELGIKADFGRVASISAAIYHYDYRDKQLYGTVQQPDPLGFLAEQTINIPKARINGAEVDLTLRPVGGLSLHGAVGYTDSKILEAPLIDAPFTTQTLPIPADFLATRRISVVGDSINLAPKWQINGDAQYEWDFAGGLTGVIGANVSYQSSTLPYLGTDELERIDARTIVGARIGIGDENAGWRVSVFGDNIFNENYTVTNIRGQDVTTRFPGMPATYGVTVDFALK